MSSAIVLAAAAFAALGIGLTLPGSLLPLLVERFGIQLLEAGSMLAFQPVGYLIAVLAAGRLIPLLGLRSALSASLLLLAVGIAGFGLAAGWVSGAVALLVSGLGIGGIEVGANTFVVQIGGERSARLLNFTHLFFGVGSFAAPALATRGVSAGISWRMPFLIGGGLIACVGLGWRAARLDPVPSAGTPSKATGSGARSRDRLPQLLALLLGLYVGCETGIGSWLTEYLTAARGLSLAEAGSAVALYWLGLTGGRLALSGFAHRVRDELLIAIAAMLASATLAGALACASARAAIVGFVATGVAFAGIFPAAIALGGRRDPADVARVTSLLIAGAGVGGIAIPFAMATIAEAAGVASGMWLYAGLAATMAAVSLALNARHS